MFILFIILFSSLFCCVVILESYKYAFGIYSCVIYFYNILNWNLKALAQSSSERLVSFNGCAGNGTTPQWSCAGKNLPV